MNLKSLLEQATQEQEWIVELRRQIHRQPELRYEEFKTSELVRKTLNELGIPFKHPIATTGVVAQLGNGVGPCVALRADMDALAIHEQADVPFRSEIPGKMHACGHDCHTAMLLGAAKILKSREHELPGTVKLIFQPAEEGGAGAAQMVREGVLENPTVQRIFGLHVWSTPVFPAGTIGGTSGAFLAATGTFRIVVRGNGGHAATPEKTHDPVLAMSHVVCALQTIVARELDPFTPAVVSVTTVHGGQMTNVIPMEVIATGTIRSLTTEGLGELRQAIERIAKATAQAYRCEATVEAIDDDIDYPATVNDAKCWETARAAAIELVSSDKVFEIKPIMGAEDFAFYAEKIPACFIGLGVYNAAIGATEFMHHPCFKVDESALPLGTAMHAAFAIKSLQELSVGPDKQ